METAFQEFLKEIFQDYLNENDYNWRILRPSSVIDLICLESASYENKPSDEKANLLFCLILVLLINTKMGAIELSKDGQKIFPDEAKVQSLVAALITSYSNSVNKKEIQQDSDLIKALNYLRVVREINQNDEQLKEIILDVLKIILSIKYNDFIS